MVSAPGIHRIRIRADITALPKSPKWAASMWLGCFLRAAVRLLEKESMLAEMALMATWLGPAASSKAWFLVLLWGECTGIGAAIKTGIVKAQDPKTSSKHCLMLSTPKYTREFARVNLIKTSLYHCVSSLIKGLIKDHKFYYCKNKPTPTHLYFPYSAANQEMPHLSSHVKYSWVFLVPW